MKMKTPLSPSDIEVLLHCHTCPGPHPRIDAPAVQEALRMFEASGLTTPHLPKWTPGGGSYWSTTPKGDAFIEALLNTPEPVQTWTVPNSKGE